MGGPSLPQFAGGVLAIRAQHYHNGHELGVVELFDGAGRDLQDAVFALRW